MGSREIDAIGDRARAMRGIITTAELLIAGRDPRVAERQVRAGHWQRPVRGVYVTHPRPLTYLDLGHAAHRLVHGRMVLSGLAVLSELGLRWLPNSSRVLALVPPDLRTRSSGRLVLRRTQELESLETWCRAGLALAPVERAVIDACRETEHLRDVRGVLLGAVADNWASVEDLEQVLATTQRNGSGSTRRALQDARRGAASPPEAELVDELIGCGVPFYVNPDVLLDGRFLGSPDIWFLGLGVGGEVESQERHGTEDDTESTYDRHERMTGATGVELVHLSVRRIRADIAEAAGHLLSYARPRTRLAQPELPGLTVSPRGPLLY
ncbi:MAG: hypothetical protein WD794_02755 [Mycobacteriales bacterium]